MWVVIIAVIILGGLWFMGQSSPSTPIVSNVDLPLATTTQEAPKAPVLDSSDVSIDSDLKNIDSQISFIGSDTATVDAGLTNPNK